MALVLKYFKNNDQPYYINVYRLMYKVLLN